MGPDLLTVWNDANTKLAAASQNLALARMRKPLIIAVTQDIDLLPAEVQSRQVTLQRFVQCLQYTNKLSTMKHLCSA